MELQTRQTPPSGDLLSERNIRNSPHEVVLNSPPQVLGYIYINHKRIRKEN